MPTIEIQGIGDVEVDDTFLELSPEEQGHVVDEIYAQVRGGNKPRGEATRPLLEAILMDAFPNAKITGRGRSATRNAEVGGATNSFHLDDDGLDFEPLPGVSIGDVRKAFASRGIKLDEALDEDGHYHIAWAGQPSDALPSSSSEPHVPTHPQRGNALTVPTSFGNFRRVGGTGGPEFGSDWDAFLFGAGDSASLGTMDAIYAHLGALVPGLANASVWDKMGNGKYRSYSDAVDLNRMDAHGMQDRLRADHPLSTVGGTLAGGLAPLGSVGAPARLAKALKGETGLAKAVVDGALTGGAYAGAYGFGNSRGNLAESVADGLSDVPLGATIGGVLGSAVPLAKLVKSAQARKFVEGQLRDNPYASFDAEIAQDLDRIISELTGKARGRKAMDEALADRTIYSRVRQLEKSYLPTRELAGLDLPPSVRGRLKQAIADRNVMSLENLEALRGSPAGDLVADRLIKAKLLNAIVPEAAAGARAGDKTATRLAVETAATGAGAMAGGPPGAAAVRVATALLDKRVPADGVSAAVKLARARAKLAPQFAKVAEQVGPSPATLSTERIARAVADGQDASYLAAQAAKRQAAKDAAAAVENQRVGVQNDLDDIRPGGGYRGMIYDQTGLLPSGQDAAALKLLNDGKITQQQFESFLSSPDELMPGRAGLSIIDRLKSMADDGTVARDPKWTAPEPVAPSAPISAGVDASGAPIRNPISYAATAKGNQDRMTLDHAKTLAERAVPDERLPVIGGRESPVSGAGESVADTELRFARFRAKYGRDADPTSIDDFNELFGINPPSPPRPVK